MPIGQKADDIDHVWDLAGKIQVAMLATWDGTKLHSRPMSAHLKREENTIYFLADKRNTKSDDIKQYPRVLLAFGDASDQKYVSISGDASVSDDRAKIKELWNSWAKAWWESAEDPNICVLKIVPVEAEFWDTPGTLINTIKMAAAIATGERPKIGEKKKVAM